MFYNLGAWRHKKPIYSQLQSMGGAKCINPYLTSGFSHHYHLGESTFIFRSIRSEEMKTEMKSVKEEIENTKATVNLEVNSMKETVSAVEKSIQDTSDRMTDLENSQEEKIKAATEKLDEKILVLDTKLKLLEKQDRKYNLLFYGFPEESGENVYKIIRQSLITELKLEEENVRNM